MPDTPIDWMEQLEALGRGDRLALAHLRRLVTGHLIRLGAYEQRSSWDDLAQEVVTRLWRAHQDGTIREPKAFVAFSRTVTRNVLVDALRRHRLEREPIDDDEIERQPMEEPGPDPSTRIALQKAIAELPERHREVVERIYVRGLSYDETARDLGRPRGTINRLQRESLKMLRAAMVPEDQAI